MGDEKGHINANGQVVRFTKAALEEYIGIDWNRKKHKFISLSNPAFMLETIADPEEKKYFLSAELNVRQLESLDVSNNALADVDVVQAENGFENLRSFKARNNQLPRFYGNLSTLLELNLACNKLVTMPPLSGMPNLEILIVSHNQISGDWKVVLKARGIKRLDLSDNRFLFKPSDLDENLREGLGKLPKLHHLRLKENDFTQFFPEYQTLVLERLPGLTKLDDNIIKEETRMEAALYKLPDMELYDSIYEARRKEYSRSGDEHAVIETIPSILHINELLDEAIADPGVCQKCVAQFVAMADRVSVAGNEEFEYVFAGVGKEDTGATKDEAQVYIEAFLQDVTIILERHDSVKSLLLRCLAKMSVVPVFEFGERCIFQLGKLMQSGPDFEDEVMTCIKEIIVPPLQEKKPNDPVASGILHGLSSLKSAKLADALSDLVPRLAKWFSEGALVGMDNIIVLLAISSEVPQNSKQMVEAGVPKQVANNLDNRQLTQNEEKRETFLNLLQIVKSTALHAEEASDVYAQMGVPFRLISQLKGFMGDDPTRLKVLEVRTCACILDAIIAIISSRSTEVLRECIDAYHLLDELMKAPKQPAADPLLLASSLDGITHVLENYSWDNLESRDFVVRQIVDGLSKLSPLLQYLGGKKYQQLYQNAERHFGSSKLDAPQAPSMSGLSNRLVHLAFVKIVELIEYFTAQTEDEICLSVSENLNAQGRETILFRLLEVPSDDLKAAVMKCIQKVKLDQLESEEIGYLVKLLCDNSDHIGAGRTEELLEKVILQLKRLAEDIGKAGDIFKKEHAEASIMEVWEILVKNSERKTYGNEDEESQKTQLSLAAVAFLRSVSRITELRRYLRHGAVNTNLKVVLSNEDLLHSPSNPDIEIEKTWTGRVVENLLLCLSGQDKIQPEKKVAFRVIQRIADTLQGRSDSLDARHGSMTAEDASRREAIMWDDVKMKRHLKYMDENEWEDRILQQQAFTSFNGIDRITQFLSTAVLSLRQETKTEVEKQENALNFLEMVQHEAQSIAHHLELEEQKAKDKDEPEILRMEELLGEEEEPDIDPEKAKASSRKMIMLAVQRPRDPARKDDTALFMTMGSDFEIQEEFFLDRSKGHVNPAFVTSALMRCCYCILSRPVAETIRRECIEFLRDPLTVRRFLALLSHCGYLNCNVSAKFLRVMAKVLALPPSQPEESIQSILLFEQLTSFTQKLCGPTLQVLKLAKGRALRIHEQILCTELGRLTGVISQNIPYINFSPRLEAQEKCVEACLARFVTELMIRSMVQMILYDLQIDTGAAHGEFINDSFVQNSIDRAGMRELCSAVLSQQLHRCPPSKYTVLEAFSTALVFQKQSVRLSYLSELLNSTTKGHLQDTLERILFERSQIHERILLIVPAEIYVNGSHTTQSRGIVLSTRAFYVVGIAPKRGSCGVCPPENFCPHDPDISVERYYSDLTRIVRGYGSQMCAIGWIKDDHEEFQIVICQGSKDRDHLIHSLHAISANHAHAELCDRVSLEFDGLVKKVIHDFVNGDWIAALTYAHRVDKGNRLGLFALTEMELFEFSIDFEYWAPDPDDEGADSDDDIGPQVDDLEEMAFEEEFLRSIPSGSSQPSGNRAIQLEDRTAYHRYIYTEKKAKGKAAERAKHSHERVAAYVNELRERREEARYRGDMMRLDAAASGFFGVTTNLNAKEKKKNLVDRTKKHIMKVEMQQPLSSLSEIAFQPGSDPVMRLDLGGGAPAPGGANLQANGHDHVTLQFYDDATREVWRRALACALNKSDTSAQWVRDWVHPSQANGYLNGK